jgi:transcriptional regulator with XRE-family HTH domain
MVLNSKKVEAAFMLASGLKQSEIATRLGVSVKTIQRWKDSAEFEKAVSDAHCNTTEIVLKATVSDTPINQEDYMTRVQLYKEQYENIGSGLVQMALLSLRLGLDAIERINPEDIGLRQLESLMRTATLCGRLGLQLKTELIGKIQTENSLVDEFSGEETAEQLIAEHTRLLSALAIEEPGSDNLPKVF